MNSDDFTAVFRKQIESLGGEEPLCEWTAKSGLVSFSYRGDLWHRKVSRRRSPAQMEAAMLEMCEVAVAALEGKVARCKKQLNGKTDGDSK